MTVVTAKTVEVATVATVVTVCGNNGDSGGSNAQFPTNFRASFEQQSLRIRMKLDQTQI
jgi:hypothetical protein